MTQVGAGVVQNLPGRADSGSDRLFQVAQVGQVPGQTGQQGQVFPVVDLAAVVAGGPGQFPNFVQFRTPQHAPQHRLLHIFPQVNAGAKLQRASEVQKPARFVGFLLTGDNFHQLGGGRQGQGPFPPQQGAGKSGQPQAYLVKLQQVQSLGKSAQNVGRKGVGRVGSRVGSRVVVRAVIVGKVGHCRWVRWVRWVALGYSVRRWFGC